MEKPLENASSDDTPQVLNRKQHLFIEALLSGLSVIEATKQAGVCEKTGWVWLKQPLVKQTYKEGQQAIFDAAINLLITDIGDARAVLRNIMKDEEAAPATRVRAAQTLLEQAISVHKMVELETKVLQLEAILKNQGRI